MGDLQRLTKLLENFDRIKDEIIDTAGEIAVTEFTLNFRKQGFNGVGWKPKKKPNGKNILIGKGTLRRSISVKKKDSRSVTIGSDVPYAYAHNNGFQRNRVSKNGKRYTITMPKRQFMGDMPSLTKKVTNMIKRKLDNLGE